MERYAAHEAKAVAREYIKGIYHAITVPESADGTIDEQGLRSDVRHCVDVLRADGLYIHGFYGIFWLLTTAERKRILEIVVDEVNGAVPIIARCAHTSLKEAIDLVEHAEATGANFISMIGPTAGKNADDMVLRHFEAIAGATNLGISLFNTPQLGYTFSPELMAKLAEIPNVCSLKNEMPLAHTVQVRQLVNDDIVVVDPSEDRVLVNILEFGQQAIFTGTGYMFDNAKHHGMRAYFDAALNGERKEATRLFYEIEATRKLHHKWVLGPWERNLRCPVATVKYWSELVGLTGGPVRAPLPNLTDEQKSQLADDLRGVGLVD